MRRATPACFGPAVGVVLAVLTTPAGADVTGGPGPAKPARAESDDGSNGVQFAATATVASDYVNRGVSQTANGPMASAGVEAGLKGFYAGLTAFRVDFRREGDRTTDAEVDLYGGYETDIGGQALDIGVIGYLYTPRPTATLGLDYAEVYAKTGRAIGPVAVTGSVYYTPRGGEGTGQGWYGVASAQWAVAKAWQISGLVGHQTVGTGGSYTAWNLGVTRTLSKKLNLDLRYWDTDHHRINRDYGAKVVIGATVTL